jgi:hypothetical protein
MCIEKLSSRELCTCATLTHAIRDLAAAGKGCISAAGRIGIAIARDSYNSTVSL